MNHRIRRLAGTAAGAATIAAGALIASPATAMAASCGTPWNVHINGGESHYTVNCSRGTYIVSGYVKDTKADGRCVQVRAVFGSATKYSPKACPKGTSKTFDLRGTGGVSVYTYVI